MEREELESRLAELEAQRVAVLAEARPLREQLNALLAAEHAAYHGLTVEEYAAVKAEARDTDTPLHEALAVARRGAARGRALQGATVQAAAVGAKAHRAKG